MRSPGRPARAAAGGAAAALLAFCLALLPGLAGAQPAEKANHCHSCHDRLGGRLGAPAREHATSVHREAGITCATCHGGNPALPDEEGMSPRQGFRGKPSTRGTPEFCARCHSSVAMMRQYSLPTDQLAEYRTSIHGRRLYGKNDANVATCTSCHGKHEIRRRSDPQSSVFHSNVPATCGKCHADPAKMKPYGLSTSQLGDFEKGVHGRILAGKTEGKNPSLAPNCATCHGVHGAVPPGVREVGNVCGNCHGTVAGYFKESAHFAAVQEIGEPKCITCHGNHSNRKPTLKVFSGTGPGECGSCHEPKSKALEFAANVRDLLGSLEANLADIRKALDEASASGRNIDRLKKAVDNARNKIIEAEPVFHAFSIDRILPLVHEADSHIREARDELRKVNEELRQRRSVAAYAVTMLLLIALLLGIKLALLSKKS